MCTGAELIPLITAAAGTAVSYGAQDSARRAQDREAAAGIMRQAEFSRQANQKVQKNIQAVEQSDPQEDITKRQAVYMDALRRAQPTTDKALPEVAGGSHRYAEDVGAARDTAATEAGTSANLMARIDAPTIQATREGQMRNDTLSQLSMLGDQSAHQDYLTRLRASMKRPNPWAVGAGQALNGYGNGAAVNNAFGGSVWDDDTASSGLTADQRRQRYVGGP